MKFRVFIVCILIMIFLSHICAQIGRQPSSRKMLGAKRYAQLIRQKPTREQKERLLPDSKDLAKYELFLEQPNTGIFRLLPDLGCEENPLVIRADEECLQAIPESSFYSFRRKEHTPEFLADIRLKNDHLITDGTLAQGILVSLGDVALERVSLNSEGLSFLTGYVPHSSGAQVQRQFLEVARGLQYGQHTYRKIFPAVEDMTFALRVIAYRGNLFRNFRGYRYNLLSGDKRIDLTVAFRIIGKNADGGVTLLWKELDRKESPRIKFSKSKM